MARVAATPLSPMEGRSKKARAIPLQFWSAFTWLVGFLLLLFFSVAFLTRDFELKDLIEYFYNLASTRFFLEIRKYDI